MQTESALSGSVRVKVLNPVTTSEPSMRAELLNFSGEGLHVRVPKRIQVGSTVQVRTRDGIAFGEVRSSAPSGADYEIGVVVERLS